MYPAYTICSAGAFCVPCIHNMLPVEHIVQGRYICYFSGRPRVHNMLFLKTCLVVFAFLSNCPLDIHLSILRTLCLKPCPHHNCIIVVFNPHQQHFGDIVSKFGFFLDMKSTFGNRSKEKWGNAGG